MVCINSLEMQQFCIGRKKQKAKLQKESETES